MAFCNCPNCPDSEHSVKDDVDTTPKTKGSSIVDEATSALWEGAERAAEYDHPFAAKDLVIAQVGWRDRESGKFYGLGQYVHDPITIEEASKPMYLRAVYEIAGRHYQDPAVA